MKKHVLFFIAMSFTVFAGWAQVDKQPSQVKIEPKYLETSGLFLKADLGVSFGIHPEIYTQTATTSANESSSSVTDAVKVRLGTGLPIEAGVGYMFNKNLGVELGIDFFKGFNTKLVNSFNGDEAKSLISAIHLSVIPMVKAQVQIGNVVPYIEIGLDVSVLNLVNTQTTGVSSLFKFKSTSTGKQNTRDFGGMALGVKAAAGVEFPLSRLISIFAQVQVEQLSYSPKHGKITKYEVDGTDVLSTLTTNQSKWDYVKSVTNPNKISQDEANQVLRVVHSFTNAGVTVGVKLKFGKG